MTPTELIAAFESLAEAPDAVARLRQLILQLAVRGRLVRQDPKDEPASVLLERIAAERARVAKSAKSRLQNPLPSVAANDAEWTLRDGWQAVRFGAVIELVSGQHLSPSEYSREPGDLPYLTGPADFGSRFPTASRWTKERRAVARKGDILVTVKGAGIGKTNVLDAPEAAISRQLMAVRPVVIDGGFCDLLLKHAAAALAEQQTGIAIPGIGRDEILDLVVFLPPLAEQSRIAARVEELMGLLGRLEAARAKREATRAAARDSVLAALREADSPEAVDAAWTRFAQRMDDLACDPADIAPLRRAVLQLAVRGRLVRQDPKDEPASLLLDRIAEERARLVKAGEAAKPKSLLPVSDADYPFTLPAGWMASRFEDVHRKLGAGSTPLGGKRVYVNDGIAFIRSQNVWDDGLRLGDVARITPATHASMKETAVQPNDVLLNITGASIGRSAIAPADIGPANVSQHVAIVRQIEPRMSAWVHLFLISPDGYRSIMGAQVGISREGLSMASLREFVLPVPPLAEQVRIVARVDELMGLLDRLEARLAAGNTLHEAFAAAAVHHLET